MQPDTVLQPVEVRVSAFLQDHHQAVGPCAEEPWVPVSAGMEATSESKEELSMEMEEAAAAGESYTMMHEEEIYMPGSGWVSPVDMAMESDKSPAEVNKHASEQASTRPHALTHSPPTYL